MWTLEAITQKEVQEINTIIKEIEQMNVNITEECSKISEKYSKIAQKVEKSSVFVGSTAEFIAKRFGANKNDAKIIGALGTLATIGIGSLIDSIGEAVAERKYRKEMERLQKLRYQIASEKYETVANFAEKLKPIVSKLKAACKKEAQKVLTNYNNLDTITKQYLEIFYLMSRTIFARQFLLYTKKEFSAWLDGYEGMEDNFEPDIMVHFIKITQLNMKWADVYEVLHKQKPLNIGTIACFYDKNINDAAVYVDENGPFVTDIDLHPNDEIKNRFLVEYVYTNPYYDYNSRIFRRKAYIFLGFMVLMFVAMVLLGIKIFGWFETWFWRIFFLAVEVGFLVWLWIKKKPDPDKYYKKHNEFYQYELEINEIIKYADKFENSED